MQVAFLLPHPLLEISQCLSASAAPLAWAVLPRALGLWNVLLADQSADKHSSGDKGQAGGCKT